MELGIFRNFRTLRGGSRVGNGPGPTKGTMDRHENFWHMGNRNRTMGHSWAMKFILQLILGRAWTCLDQCDMTQ